MRVLIFLLAITLSLPLEAISQDISKEAEKERLQRIEKRVTTIKKLDRRIANLDQEILSFQREINDYQKSIESLELQEAQAKQNLEHDLDRLSLMARNMVRTERLPLDILTFHKGNMRDNHKRIGIINQGRKSLAQDIQNQRQNVYELQEIRLAKKEHTENSRLKQSKIAAHRKKLQKLFDKQVKSLKLDDTKQAKLLANARKAANKANNIEQLAKMARQVSLTAQPIKHRTYKFLPVRGRIVKEYGVQNHVGVKAQGITVETTTAEPVKALKDGRIIYSDHFRDYGHVIIVEHQGGVNTLYSGLNSSHFKVGDYTRAGQIIGLMPKENTPELYLEVRQNGNTINPLTFLKKNNS